MKEVERPLFYAVMNNLKILNYLNILKIPKILNYLKIQDCDFFTKNKFSENSENFKQFPRSFQNNLNIPSI